jgi:hypothetical protein
VTRRPYIPEPNTVAGRVLAYLRAQPPGTELCSAALAEACSFNKQAASPFLASALAAGLVKQRIVRNEKARASMWSLGDGVPVQTARRARRPHIAPAPKTLKHEISPAARYEVPAPAGSFMAEWRRLRGEGA